MFPKAVQKVAKQNLLNSSTFQYSQKVRKYLQYFVSKFVAKILKKIAQCGHTDSA